MLDEDFLPRCYRLTELHNHLAVITRDIVYFQFTLIAHTLEELSLLGMIKVLYRILSLELLGLGECLALDIRHHDLSYEVDDLCRDSKVEHLVADSSRVDFELPRSERLLSESDDLCCLLPELKERSKNVTEGDVDECGKEKSHVGSHEVQDKLLLDESGAMS